MDAPVIFSSTSCGKISLGAFGDSYVPQVTTL
jgi:hypothetical protein